MKWRGLVNRGWVPDLLDLESKERVPKAFWGGAWKGLGRGSRSRGLYVRWTVCSRVGRSWIGTVIGTFRSELDYKRDRYYSGKKWGLRNGRVQDEVLVRLPDRTELTVGLV